MNDEVSSIDLLRRRVNGSWPVVDRSIASSKRKRQELRELFSQGTKLDSEDRSIVAFGSVGRDEWTTDSDLDWTLLIDGQADPAHLLTAQTVRSNLKDAKFKAPSASGVFGNMAFSHEIIHRIGGENDTNRNMTQRILLLLESRVIGTNSEAYDRVIRGILHRYLEEETGFPDQDGRQYGVPRFLLNDIVRFWRTMAVDFASKQRERAGAGWGLRNAKLRMSRKLIFVSGLLMCFDCAIGTPRATILEHLLSLAEKTPLEILAEAILLYETDEIALKIFGAYDQFLAILQDGSARQRLDELTAHQAASDGTFKKVREISHEFQSGLNSLFFKNTQFSPLTIKYGVF